MRLRFLLASLAFAAFAPAAIAGPVSLAPVSFSAEFQTSLDENFGAREGAVLRRAVTEAVSSALARRGANLGPGGIVVEISILDADPNRPTMQQLVHTPGLDYGRSLSIGGASLSAVLRGADGAVIAEVTHRRYNTNIQEVALGASGTWSEARHAIRQFAEKVADAYAAAGN